MTTPLQRQRLRQEAEIAREAKLWHERMSYDARNGPGAALAAAARVFESKERMRLQMPVATAERLAIATRYIEQIIAAKHPTTGEVIARTDRVVSLVDVMHKDKQISMDLWHAASRYRDLFLSYMGRSKGVASYGDYVEAGPASQRLGITDLQMKSGGELKAATAAAFAVVNSDGKWVVDQELMELVIPAILAEKKEVTQGSIGAKRTAYKGRAQVNAAGGNVVHEVLHRLAMHFGYRDK